MLYLFLPILSPYYNYVLYAIWLLYGRSLWPRKTGNVNGGIVIGVPIDTIRLEYGVRINYSLNETLQIGGDCNWAPNCETAGYEIELTIKYVFSAWGIGVIYSRFGPQVGFWAINDPTAKPVVLVSGIGLTRNIKFLTVFYEFSWEKNIKQAP